MQPIRVKTVQESDLRMLGNLARNIQRVLPVTQADIDAAAALGKNWVVWKVFEVAEPLDNMRGGTQLIIRQNSVLPGQNVRRVIFVSGPGGQTVIVRGSEYIALPDAIADSLEYLKAFGGTEQRNLPSGYTELEYIESTGTQYIDTGVVPTKNTKIEIHNIQKVSDAAFGVYGQIYTFTASGANNYYSFGGVPNSGAYAGPSLINLDATIVMSKDDGLVINGQQVVAFSNVNDFTTDLTFWLFARNNTTPNYKMGAQRTYYFKMWNNGTLVRNLIPAKRNSDNVIGMYDTVSGTFFTNAGTGTFAAGGEAVPTPDTPMDIVSNNGVLKARNLRRVPDGYKEVEYLESTGEEYIDLGDALNTASDDVELDIQVLDTASVTNIFGARGSTTQRVYTLATNGGYWRWGWKNNSNATTTETDLNKHVLRIDHTNNTLSLDGTVIETKGIGSANIVTPTIATLFAIHASSGSDYYFGAVKVFGYKKWTDGVLAQNLVPCRRKSDNVLGMYDLVTDTFFTNAAETGAFIAGADMPDYEIYTDGTVETINVHGNNLFDITSLTRNAGYMVSTVNGLFVTSDQYTRSDYMPCLPNTEYTRTASGAASTVFYDRNKNFLSARTGIPFTTPADCHYIIYNVRNNVDYSQGMMVKGDELPTTYQPYFNGGTATAEMLLKVGDYEDVQEILSGAVTRNVGVKVLDGTEGWKITSGSDWVYYDLKSDIGSFNTTSAIATHFEYAGANQTAARFKINTFSLYNNGKIAFKSANTTNISDWKQYLADQYAAGTPVIVLYPLATPTTESVAGQPMQVQQGDNIVEITQAAIDNLELEAKYQAAVSLTIQEVQDANLDPNVQVTIN